MDIGHRGRLDSWTTQFRHTNEISTSNGSVLQLPAGARPLDESESASVADGESSAAVSEPGDDEEGLVMQATEWSQVVAARGIRGVRTPRRTVSSPTPLRRMLSLQYGCTRSDFQTKSPTYDHRYPTKARMQKEVIVDGYSDNVIVGGVQLDELDMNVNVHPVTSGGQGGVEGFGFDYEPAGATSVHDTVVTDTTTMEALRERIQELERTWDADIAAAAWARHEELANDNARLTRRIHELEAELEYSSKASDEEVATLHRRIRDLRKSFGENMAAAADEFASLNQRLTAKDAELKAKGDEAARLKQEAKELQCQQQQHQLPQPSPHQVEASSPPQMTSSATMTSPSPVMTSSSTMTSSPTLASSLIMTSPSTVPLPFSESPSPELPASSSTSDSSAKPSRSLFRCRPRAFNLRGKSRTFSSPVPHKDDGIAAKLRRQIDEEEEEEEKDPPHEQEGMQCEFRGISADASRARGDDSAGRDNPTEDSKKDRINSVGRVARGYFRTSRNTGSRKDKRFSKLKPVNRSPSPSKGSKTESDVRSSPSLALKYSTLSDTPTAMLSSSSSLSSTPASESSPNGSERCSLETKLTLTDASAGVAQLAHVCEVGSRSVPVSQQTDNTGVAAMSQQMEEADSCVSDHERMASLALRAAVEAETEAQARCRELLSLLEAAEARMAEAETQAESAVRAAEAAEAQAKEREMAAITAESAASEAVKEARAKEAESSALMESALAKAQLAEKELAKARSAAATATHQSTMFTYSPARYLPMASPLKAQYGYRPSPRAITVADAGTVPGTGFGPAADIPKIPKGLVSKRASAYMALATASALSTAATARLCTKVQVIEKGST